ncbi:MAG: glycosyltransferase family 39 protein [Candidatus Binatia bacterium]|nr:glycosyltransferase family 39 protein [Candidatus Binatia bacterium]
MRTFDVVALLVLGIVAMLLRVAPIAEMTLWWDELVHLKTATKGGFFSVFEAVKLGIPPGFGNAGAVPADYLLLNAWLRSVPAPSLEWIEAYYRTPALLWSVVTVLFTYVYVRRFFDRGVALVAATILAISVSHSLYAAEVRNYSMFALMAVVNLYAFSALVLRRRSTGAWIAYTAVAVVYFSTGFMSLLVTLGQYLILAVLLLMDLRKRPKQVRELVRLAFPLASGLAVLSAVGAYLRGTFLGVRYGRATDGIDTWERTYTAFDFFAGGNPLLLAAFFAGLALLIWHGWQQGRDRVAIAAGLGISFFAIPIIVEIERWKEYYFHPRHSFFLLPIFAIVAAGGLLVAVRGLDPLRRTKLRQATRKAIYTALALVLVVGTEATPVVRHLDNPNPRFKRSKTVRHFKSLMVYLQDQVAALEPDQVYLLIAERRRPGHISNPVLATYLEWYGLDDRVILRGSDRPIQTRQTIHRLCPEGCVGEPAARVQKKVGAIGPFNSMREMLELLEVSAAPQTAAPVGQIGLLHYWRHQVEPPSRAPGFVLSTHVGMSLFEKPLAAAPDRLGNQE